MEFEPTTRSSVWVIRGGVPRTRATVDVCFTPEKVLAAVGPNFLRAADAFYTVRHGGPHQLEQNLSATLFFG
jgi:hypothetical protein